MQTPFSGLFLMHRLLRISTPAHVQLSNRIILGKSHKCRRVMRTLSTSFVDYKENEGDNAESSPLSTKLAYKHALLSKRRRPLSPLERISGMLPQDTLSPEVMQLREQNQQDPEDGTNIQETVAQVEDGHEIIPSKVGSDTPHAPDEELLTAETQPNTTFNEDRSLKSSTLPGENLIAFGELLVAEYHRQGEVGFRKMFELQRGARLMSGWGIIMHDDIAGQPAGSFLKTSRGVSLFIRRASLEDYVLFMKRGPAISYPKDAVTMLMMMDVTEGDCVLESGSGSGGMSLFLSRAVGSKGRVLSLEVREDHHKRAVLNYKRWRAAWSQRRGEEWPDNVQFLQADLSTASSFLTGQGFHSVALDLTSPHLVLSTVTPHLHPGGVCAVYLANITQVTDLLEGLRCLRLPLLRESIVEVPIRDWLVAPALQKDGRYCRRKDPRLIKDQGEDETLAGTDRGETATEEEPAFGSIPYIARPHPEQKSHTAFLVKLRKYVR